MNWRTWMEIIIVVSLLLITTNVITWHAGKHNGAKWENYRLRTKAISKGIPYSGLFYDDVTQYRDKIPPLKVVVKRGK